MESSGLQGCVFGSAERMMLDDAGVTSMNLEQLKMEWECRKNRQVETVDEPPERNEDDDDDDDNEDDEDENNDEDDDDDDNTII
jgi:hypothetical protein